jgi:hypothetical protein
MSLRSSRPRPRHARAWPGHPSKKKLQAKGMDCRVKPGNDSNASQKNSDLPRSISARPGPIWYGLREPFCLHDTLDSPSTKAFTPEQLELVRRLSEIFMPFANRTRTAMIERRGRFVHYTSAANALEIIRTKRWWMRSKSPKARASGGRTDSRRKQHLSPCCRRSRSQRRARRWLDRGPLTSTRQRGVCTTERRTFSNRL